jgi:hypothetical protein
MRVDGDTEGRRCATSMASNTPLVHATTRMREPGGGEPRAAVLPTECASNDNASRFRQGQPYIGVILRQVRQAGIAHFEIILAHPQPNLSRLYASHPTDETVIAEWRGLGERLRLPLLILNEAGALEAVTGCTTDQGGPRRGGSALSGRRPRFLVKRQTGNLSILGITYPCIGSD